MSRGSRRRAILTLAALLACVPSCPALGDGIGVPIAAPLPLNTNAVGDFGQDFSPRLATDGAGHWVAVWHSNENLGRAIGTDYDIFVSRSDDFGMHWTDPAVLNSTANADGVGADRFPSIATDGKGLWITLWQSSVHPDGSLGNDQDVMISRSTDNGETWSPMAYLGNNAATDKGNDLDPVIETDGAGAWVAAWRTLDSLQGSIGNDGDILFARSTDGGSSWTDPAPLNSNASVDSGHDIKPQLACDGGGHWVCVWHSNDSLGGTIGTDDDILCARSDDNGVSWSPPQPVNSNAPAGNADEFDAHIACDGVGHWVAVWSSTDSLGGTIGTDRDILFSRSEDNGQTWSPCAALNSNAATDTGTDQLPIIITDRQGEWIAAWYSNDTFGGTLGSDDDVFIARSIDNGATWTAPVPLNTNAAADFGADDTPFAATDRHGAWVFTWEKNDASGSPLGTDGDVLCARLALPDCDLDTSPDSAEPDSDGDGIPDACDRPSNPCVPDIAPRGGDGVVNIDDLLAIINAWGPCPGACPADIAPSSGDGVINIDDLLAIINGWGPCP